MLLFNELYPTKRLMSLTGHPNLKCHSTRASYLTVFYFKIESISNLFSLHKVKLVWRISTNKMYDIAIKV